MFITEFLSTYQKKKKNNNHWISEFWLFCYVIVHVADGAGDPDEGNDFTHFSTVADTFTLHAMFLDCIFQGVSGSCDPFCY